MPILRRTNKPSPQPAASLPSGAPPSAAAVKTPPPPPAIPPDPKTTNAAKPAAAATVPHPRIGAAWVWLCIAVLALTVLIVFMAQNTQKVRVDFLWMTGTLPLDLALLIAGAIVGVVTAIAGTARITQLRRVIQQRRRPDRNRSYPGSSE